MKVPSAFSSEHFVVRPESTQKPLRSKGLSRFVDVLFFFPTQEYKGGKNDHNSNPWLF
jgi:hypothetical protein